MIGGLSLSLNPSTITLSRAEFVLNLHRTVATAVLRCCLERKKEAVGSDGIPIHVNILVRAQLLSAQEASFQEAKLRRRSLG